MKRNDPYTRDDQTRFTMRINTELLEKIRADAEKNKRSTAKQIEYVLEQYILLRQNGSRGETPCGVRHFCLRQKRATPALRSRVPEGRAPRSCLLRRKQ